MTENSNYAQERVIYYRERFQNQSVLKLVDVFNSLSSNKGWTSERSFFTKALIDEIHSRGIDTSAICEEQDNRQTIRYIPVRYEQTSHSLSPID